MKSELIHGDCLSVLPNIGDQSIHLVLSDLPYGLTSCKWDCQLPLDALWTHFWRILKPNGCVILTASQPFTSVLVMSQVDLFRHEWVWIKNRGSNFANTVREPMKEHESVLVFSRGKWTYNKQMQERTGAGLSRVQYDLNFRSKSENYREFEGREDQKMPVLRVPSSWQKYNTETGLHPTQKPVDLFRYFIRTYTNTGDVVLDPCVGSGTTLIAAMREGREGVGIEKDNKFFNTAKTRIAKEEENNS